MSTAYTFDATIAMAPARRAPSSLDRRIAETSQSRLRAAAKILVSSAVVAIVTAALLAIPSENRIVDVRECTLATNPHVSRLAVERDWHTHGLPVLGGPTSASCTER